MFRQHICVPRQHTAAEQHSTTITTHPGNKCRMGCIVASQAQQATLVASMHGLSTRRVAIPPYNQPGVFTKLCQHNVGVVLVTQWLQPVLQPISTPRVSHHSQPPLVLLGPGH